MAKYFSILAQSVRAALAPRRVHNVTVAANTPEEIVPLLHWADRKAALRLHLPVSMLVMESAFAYEPASHHFLTALSRGESALTEFYRRFQPANLAAMYAVAAGRRGADLPPWEIPWLLSETSRAPRGEGRLGPEHGAAVYGPATAQKVQWEMKRLTATRDSIRRRGFQPDQHGDITGFFLRRGGEFRFLVRGGKHRTAALVHLGHTTVPVQMKPLWPRLIDRADAAHWPLVQNGQMDAGLAMDIFDRHFGLTLTERYA
jgi:hypothetical protein